MLPSSRKGKDFFVLRKRNTLLLLVDILTLPDQSDLLFQYPLTLSEERKHFTWHWSDYVISYITKTALGSLPFPMIWRYVIMAMKYFAFLTFQRSWKMHCFTFIKAKNLTKTNKKKTLYVFKAFISHSKMMHISRTSPIRIVA